MCVGLPYKLKFCFKLQYQLNCDKLFEKLWKL